MLDDTLFDPLDRTEDGDFTESNFRRILDADRTFRLAAGARVDQLYGLTRLGRRSTWTRTRTRTTTPRATTTRSSTRRAVESDDDEQLSLTPMEE